MGRLRGIRLWDYKRENLEDKSRQEIIVEESAKEGTDPRRIVLPDMMTTVGTFSFPWHRYKWIYIHSENGVPHKVVVAVGCFLSWDTYEIQVEEQRHTVQTEEYRPEVPKPFCLIDPLTGFSIWRVRIIITLMAQWSRGSVSRFPTTGPGSIPELGKVDSAFHPSCRSAQFEGFKSSPLFLLRGSTVVLLPSSYILLMVGKGTLVDQRLRERSKAGPRNNFRSAAAK
ncbi:hypothetical protein TNCV_3276351 [Trichonephila clavipes]|nr:hypothetical protein TNCV_3276351 [Trichonephila clavipes]